MTIGTITVLPIGTVIHGFCGGLFSNDSAAHKRIEAVGVDWVVLREISLEGELHFVAGPGIHDRLRKADAEWHADKESQPEPWLR